MGTTMVNVSSSSLSMINNTLFDNALPSLPEYTLRPVASLLEWIPDTWLSVVAPVVVYWVTSLVFHLIDVFDLFPQYRLHTPEEITRRNHVSRFEVFRDVIIQHIIQIVTGALLAYTEPIEMTGKADYDVAVWATRLRLAQRAIPRLLGALGVNATALSKNIAGSWPMLAGTLSGGYYPFLISEAESPAFATWEIEAAKLIYHILVPALQFFGAVVILDAWQYFLHRFMHMNKWMYTTIHSRHHRLYVPYAYGALYNHPLEGFLLDTLGASIAFKAMGMTLRQGMCFFSFSSLKTVDDHCGYEFPWDPLQLITSNNAAYHDIHHQNWGIKTNFSQPFFTFWDGFLGTRYEGKKNAKSSTKDEANGSAHLHAKANNKGK